MSRPRAARAAPQAAPAPRQRGATPSGRAAPNLGVLALAMLALIWGYNWVVMKIGLRYSQPFTFAALRSFLGALGLFVLLAVLRRPLRPKALGLTSRSACCRPPASSD